MFESQSQPSEKLLTKAKTSKEENENDEQYIFYGQKKKFTNKVELDVMLNSNHSIRALILIDYKSTLKFLSVKIADYMEHFPMYSNLEGLKAINISKKTEKGNISIPIETGGEIKDYLENGNVLYCDLKTDEYWIKTSLNMHSNQMKLSISLEIKNRLEMPMKKLKLLLIKTGLNFWIDFCKNKNNDFHYIYVDAKCRTSKSKQDKEFTIEDMSKTDQIDDMLVQEIFDFESEIICDLKLISIEELIFMELNKLKSQDFINKFKFEDMQQVTFEEFSSSKKFEEEMRTIQKLIKKSLKNPVFDIQGKIYCYNKATITTTGESSTVNTEGVISSSIIIMPSRTKKSKNLNSVLEESKERQMDDSSLSRKDRSLTLNHKKGYSTFIEEKSNRGEDLKRSENTDILVKLESADDSRLYESSRKQTMKPRITDDSNKEVNKFKIPNCLSAKNLCENTEKLIINVDTENNSELNNNFIRTNTNNTNIYVEEGCESDQQKFLKTLKGSKIITHTKALDKEEGFPGIGIEINRKDKKHKKKKSDNFQNFRIVTNKSLTLCNDIRELINLQKFNIIIDSHSKIKICKFALEKITMPQFRNVKMNDVKKEETFYNTTQNLNNNNTPEDTGNKRVIFFVVFLILIFMVLVFLILFK